MIHSEIVIDRGYAGFNPIQFGHQACAPGHAYGPAVRAYWLLHYVESGSGIFEYAGKTYCLRPGEIFVIPPYEETYYEADQANPWRYIWIGFTAAEIPPQFKKPVLRCPDAGAIFTRMKRCARLDNGRSAFLSACLWELFGLLLEQGKPQSGYVEKALNCIHSEYMRGITVQEIARRLNLDRSYFSALFHRQTGVSPQEYLIAYRLERALELMTVYGESPSMAAASSGYPDLYQFSKIFKKRYGLSPRAYLKSETPGGSRGVL